MESGGQKGPEERLRSRDRQAFTSRGDLKDNQQGPQEARLSQHPGLRNNCSVYSLQNRKRNEYTDLLTRTR